jgi:hypothetical protein
MSPILSIGRYPARLVFGEDLGLRATRQRGWHLVQSATRRLKLSLTSPKAYRISLRKINVYGEAASVGGLFNFNQACDVSSWHV